MLLMPPVPPGRPGCRSAGLPPITGKGDVSLSGLTGGVITTSGSITVTGLNSLTSDITLIADKNITIKGKLTGPNSPPPGTPAINITIVSNSGNVVIDKGAMIAPGWSADGDNDFNQGMQALARGHAGTSAGIVSIRGINVSIAGFVFGGGGGKGGRADAIGQSLSKLKGSTGGTAEARGGIGGHGGAVRICAYDSIGITTDGRVFGGLGGGGGVAMSNGDEGSWAFSQAGNAGDASDVDFNGTGPTPCQIFVMGSIYGGNSPHIDAMRGGYADATGGDGSDALNHRVGGKGSAFAGRGGHGGGVYFTHCLVKNTGTIRSGSGGRGGKAVAQGGQGLSTPSQGYFGGDAEARGGYGNDPGSQPEWIDLNGIQQFGEMGSLGAGGDSTATCGGGGSATVSGPGGRSGKASATGGSNLVGVGGNQSLPSSAAIGPAGAGAATANGTGSP